jgi:hypothetical protein
VILSIWQALHEMIAKGCSLCNPGGKPAPVGIAVLKAYQTELNVSS